MAGFYDTNWYNDNGGTSNPPIPRLLMTNLSNGQTTTNITYWPLNNPVSWFSSAATGDNYPINDIYPSTPVVLSFTVDDGVGTQRHNSYAYLDLKADRTWRGLLGFSSTWSQAVESGLLVQKVFDQNFPYTGFLQATSGYYINPQTSQTQQLSQTINVPACQDFVTPNLGCTVQAGNRYFVYRQSSTLQHWDLSGGQLPGETVVSTYGDGSGNETQTVKQTGDGYCQKTARTFNNDTTDWLIGRLAQTTETRSNPWNNTGACP